MVYLSAIRRAAAGYGPLKRVSAYLSDRPMDIEGRLAHERERLSGMTMEERAWRKKWLKDQELAPGEPKYVKELGKQVYNPMIRLYKTPTDWLFYDFLSKFIGMHLASLLRWYFLKVIVLFFSLECIIYYLRYHQMSWECKNGWNFQQAKPILYPGDPGYGNRKKLYPDDFASQGFKQRKVLLDYDTTSTSIPY